MQDAYHCANSVINIGHRGTQDNLDPNNNNISIILVSDQFMDMSNIQKSGQEHSVNDQPLESTQHVNYWVDDNSKLIIPIQHDSSDNHIDPETFLKPQVTISVLERPEDDWQVQDPHADAPGTARGQLQNINSDDEEEDEEEHTPQRLLQAEINEEEREMQSPDVINY